MHYIKKSGILLGMMGLFALVGCSPLITSGEVCGRRVVPEHEVEIDDTITIEMGDFPLTIPGSHMETVPDTFFITFRKMDESTNQWMEREITVSENDYDKYKNGDLITLE